MYSVTIEDNEPVTFDTQVQAIKYLSGEGFAPRIIGDKWSRGADVASLEKIYTGPDMPPEVEAEIDAAVEKAYQLKEYAEELDYDV